MNKLYILATIATIIVTGVGCTNKVTKTELNTEIEISEGATVKITNTPVEIVFAEYKVPPALSTCPKGNICDDLRPTEIILKINGKKLSMTPAITDTISIDNNYSAIVQESPSDANSLSLLVYEKGKCDGIINERKRWYCLKESNDFMGCTKLIDAYAKNMCMNGLIDDVAAVGNAKIEFTTFCESYFGNPQTCMDMINKSLAATKGPQYCEKIIDSRDTGIKDECYRINGADCSLIKSEYSKLQCEVNRSKNNNPK